MRGYREFAAPSIGGVSIVQMLASVSVELSVVLGATTMPIHQLLRMGRGAVIELDATEKDDVMLLANNVPVAWGTVIIRGDRVAIEITEMIQRPEIGEIAA